MNTPTRQLADTLLSEGIDQFIAERRARTPRASWRRIALDLRDTTKGTVDVTPETLRKWAAGSASDTASAA